MLIKKFVVTTAFLGLSTMACANLENFFDNFDRKIDFIHQNELPKPFDYLLTQPLLTKGLENYYKRNTLISPIKPKLDTKNNIYARSILMLADRRLERNNVEQAKLADETIAIEFSAIKINFNALPKTVINEVLNSNIPFGKLLINRNISVKTTDRSYFKIKCDNVLSQTLTCPINTYVFGRTNTILDSRNMEWLAKVTEIISGKSF